MAQFLLLPCSISCFLNGCFPRQTDKTIYLIWTLLTSHHDSFYCLSARYWKKTPTHNNWKNKQIKQMRAISFESIAQTYDRLKKSDPIYSYNIQAISDLWLFWNCLATWSLHPLDLDMQHWLCCLCVLAELGPYIIRLSFCAYPTLHLSDQTVSHFPLSLLTTPHTGHYACSTRSFQLCRSLIKPINVNQFRYTI